MTTSRIQTPFSRNNWEHWPLQSNKGLLTRKWGPTSTMLHYQQMTDYCHLGHIWLKTLGPQIYHCWGQNSHAQRSMAYLLMSCLVKKMPFCLCSNCTRLGSSFWCHNLIRNLEIHFLILKAFLLLQRWICLYDHWIKMLLLSSLAILLCFRVDLLILLRVFQQVSIVLLKLFVILRRLI